VDPRSSLPPAPPLSLSLSIEMNSYYLTPGQEKIAGIIFHLMHDRPAGIENSRARRADRKLIPESGIRAFLRDAPTLSLYVSLLAALKP